MPDLGPAELVIILLVVVMIFGSQRLGELGGSLGKGIRDFRRELKDDSADVDEVAVAAKAPDTAVMSNATDPGAASDATAKVACAGCGTLNVQGAMFCSECGKALSAATEN